MARLTESARIKAAAADRRSRSGPTPAPAPENVPASAVALAAAAGARTPRRERGHGWFSLLSLLSLLVVSLTLYTADAQLYGALAVAEPLFAPLPVTVVFFVLFRFVFFF